MMQQLLSALAARYEAQSPKEYYEAIDRLALVRRMIGLGNYYLLFHPEEVDMDSVTDESDFLF